jgi:cob(I)alamin adenosyltransferase
MGNRLSKIVTRTGDAGTTGLTGGDRVAKTHVRIQAMGDVDELNSQLGMLLTQRLAKPVRETLMRIQHELFDLGGEISMPGSALITEAHVKRLETDVEKLNAKLPPLREFVLPGGSEATARCHLARAVARRGERALWAVHESEPLNPFSLRYANRLSDFLFVLARSLARRRGTREVTWAHRR